MIRYIAGTLIFVGIIAAQDEGRTVEVFDKIKPINETAIEAIKQDIQDFAEPNRIIGHQDIKSFIQQVNAVELFGSSAQQQEVQHLIASNGAPIRQQIMRDISEFLTSRQFRKTMAIIFESALQGAVLPLIVVANQFMSGHINPAELGQTAWTAIETPLVYGSMLAMVSILRNSFYTGKETLFALENGGVKSSDSLTLQALHVAVKDTSFFTLPKTAIVNEVTSIITASIDSLGGIPKLLAIETPQEKMEFGKKVLFGQRGSSKYRQPVQHFADKLSFVFHNRRLREALANVLFAAAEGAAISATLYFLGLSFSEESDIALTMLSSAARGATLGLLNYFVNKKEQIGSLENASEYLIIRTAQNILQSGSPEIALTDIAPAVVKQIAASAVETAVNQMGGWHETAQTLGSGVAKGTSARWGSWYKNAKEKAGKLFNWLADDLNRSAQAGVL